MIQRYRLAFLLSLLTFITLFAIYLHLPTIEKKLKRVETKVIKIALVTPIKKITPPVKIEKKSITQPVIIKKPKPKKIVKKKIVKKKIPKKKIIKKKRIVKKRVIKKVKKKKIIKQKTIQKKIIPKKIIPAPIEQYSPITPPVYHPITPVHKVSKAIEEPVFKATEAPSSQNFTKNDHLKKAFLRNVRTKIIANKTYPKIAKRRHIEGSVKVRFDITINGNVTNIRFINGKRIFQKSIKKTLAHCFPINVPNNVKSELPIQDVSVVLHFNIR